MIQVGCQTGKIGRIQIEYEKDVQKIFEIRDKVKEIHPFLKEVFPIAIVEDDSYYIFDVDSTGKKYVFVKKEPTLRPIPKGIRAAYPLACYENKIACVISPEIFAPLEGYVTIFHEFMHCSQFQVCEQKLKQNLKINLEAVKNKNYMWELNFPFPYEDKKFTEIYSLFLKASEENNTKDIIKSRKLLKQTLSKDNYEYMVWQEWKEGFARFFENRIRRKLELEENFYGLEKPYHRISFYEGGSKFIGFLSKEESELLVDIENLFYRMFNIE